MKVIVLLVLGCLALDALGSPIVTPTKSETKQLDTPQTGRQDTQNQIASTDDDDDDDDDDDIDLGDDIEEDDDDDDDDDATGTAANDEEDDDDDEGDYFERFFDDLLGDDDDDDEDDDDSSASSSNQQPVSTVAQAGPPPDVAAELPASEQSSGDVTAYEDENNNEVVATIDSEAEKDPQVTSAPAAVVAAATTPAAQPITSESEDDDDDLGLEEDDDDDDDDDDDEDDEEDEDDDDDDEEDDIEDVIGARSAAVKPRAMDNNPSPRVPPSFITKYNRYVDNILERINKVLRTGYDPVNVRLHSVKKDKKPAKKTSSKKNKDKKKKKTKKSVKIEETNPVNVTISTVMIETTTESGINVTTTPKIVSRAQPPKKNSTKTKLKATTSTKNSKPRAKATLYGMASLKRSDDVVVNVMSSHTTVKTRFTIGPLTLKVEKEFGRGAKKELRSATATTTEMVGKINLRLKHGGTATLHSIRVMQPNLLRVDAPEDHDETREFVWRRSSHIAEIVSQKLTKAARSLLAPPPQPAKQKKKKPANSGFLSYLF